MFEHEYKGWEIKIIQDEDAASPEEWDDSVVFIAAFHQRNCWIVRDNLRSPEDLESYDWEKTHHVFPLYAYIHSGVVLSLGDFADPWDSGQVGYVLVSKTEAWTTDIKEIARSKVNEWNDYFSGNVYGYTVTDPEGEEKDSCWGFYGDPDGYILEQAKGVIDHYVTADQLPLAL